MKTIFKNANLIDGINPLKENVSVIIEDNKIVDIISGDNLPEGTVIDCSNKYLMPGMINLHIHLFGTGMPSKILGGGSLQQKVVKFAGTKLGKKVLAKIVETNARNEFFSGVTTARTAGDFYYSDVELRDNINNGKIVGPTLYVSGPAITVPGGHGDGTISITGDTPEQISEKVREVASHGVDHIKICITGGVMDAKKKGEPGELKMTTPFAKAACDTAHELGLMVASHTESPEGVQVAIESKVDTIEHGSLIYDEDLVKLKEYGGAFVCTMSPALPLAKLDPEFTKLNPLCVYNSEVVFDNMVKGAIKLLENDAKVGLGTDASCPLVTQYNTYMEVKYAGKFLNMSNLEAINTITMKNAEIIHREDEIGSIEVGKYADMLLLDRNPLEDLDNLKDLEMIIKRGEIYKDITIKKNQKIEEQLSNLFNIL